MNSLESPILARFVHPELFSKMARRDLAVSGTVVFTFDLQSRSEHRCKWNFTESSYRWRSTCFEAIKQGTQFAALIFLCIIFANCSNLKMNHKHPRLSCPPLEEFSPSDWKSVAAAFAKSPAVRLGQSWREQQNGFRSAIVRSGLRGDTLWVFAEIEDIDVFNPATGFNEYFFLHGDAFEIFLRPAGQCPYFEFHVGPANQLFQQRIPSAGAFARQAEGEAEEWKIASPAVRTWATVDRERPLWRVLIAIPFDTVVEKGGSRVQWLISFSRYDYTRGQKGPVMSSSSPHANLGFHRQQEWATMVFTRNKKKQPSIAANPNN
jgi:hypothetical protein